MVKKISILQIDETAYLIHKQWMNLALQLAAEAGDAGDVPVGAVVVDRANNLVSFASNRKERDRDPTAHAEILALRAAGKAMNSWHLDGCSLYATLEPCPMCAGAIVQARIGLLVYGADDPKTGAIRTAVNIPDSAASNHRLLVLGGIMESSARVQLQSWFKKRREK